MKLILVCFLLFSTIIYCQDTETLNVKSIDLSLKESSDPKWLTESENYIYFTANDGIRGRELWKLEKENSKISIVKDIKEGEDSSFDTYFELGEILVGDLMIFFPCDSPDGSLVTRSLWRTDGTESGTYKLLNVSPGLFNDNYYVKYNESIYFTGDNEQGQTSLWKSNGTNEGTNEVKFNGESLKNINNIFVVENSLYFTANFENKGLQLWKIDGSDENIQLVTNIGDSLSNGISYFNEFLVFGGYIYFYADDGVVGNELWRTDGTIEGTELFMDIFPGSNDWQINSSNNGLTGIVQSNYFLFTAKSSDTNNYFKLYKSDGTVEGTQPVLDHNITSLTPQFYGAENAFINYGAETIFKATKSNMGEVLWITDGTSIGTKFLKDFYPENNVSSISDFSIANGYVYLLADESFDSRHKL